MVKIPTYQDVLAAAGCIEPVAIRTPLIENGMLNELTGARVFLKPECLQVTGSFKFRGAYNAISAMGEDPANGGVVTCSSGNHGQGVAQAANLLNRPATIVMPEDSPEIKVQRTMRSGAQIVTYDRERGDRDAIADEICKRENATFIHPYDNALVIAGQGTVGLEACEQVKARGENIDRVLVCTGGGGLTAGISLAVSEQFPNAKIHSVEPEGFDDYRRSLIEGEPVSNASKSGSVCDAVLTEKPGDVAFSINKDLLSEGLVVSDDEALGAVKFAFHELKLVVEPGGAVALAALLKAGQQWSDETIVCIISGGNIDPNMMQTALNDN